MTVVIAWLSLRFFVSIYFKKNIFGLYIYIYVYLSSLLCLETTSESGVSDLETSMTDFRCTCCPYGYHLDTDFMKFLDDMYGPDVLRTLKKIERKRHDVRRRLINEQQVRDIDIFSKSTIIQYVIRTFSKNEYSYTRIDKEFTFTVIVLDLTYMPRYSLRVE